MACRRSQLRLIAAAISIGVLTGLAIAEDSADGPYAVPQNYREMIARYILATTDRDKIHRAQITTPGVSDARASRDTPNVCASVWLKGAIIEPSFVIGLTFFAGQIAGTFNPADNHPKVGGADAAVVRFGPTCDHMTDVPFPEITASQR
jgi:hypothetical protein